MWLLFPHFGCKAGKEAVSLTFWTYRAVYSAETLSGQKGCYYSVICILIKIFLWGLHILLVLNVIFSQIFSSNRKSNVNVFLAARELCAD